MKNWLNNYFSFTKREYNGLLVLVVLIVAVSILPYFYSLFYTSKNNLTLTQAAIQKLQFVKENNHTYVKNSAYQPNNSKKSNAVLFNFNPNTNTQSDWQNLGLSAKQAKAIVNYTQKGGKFYKPEDLQKMYTISPETYLKLLPYIKIETPQKVQNNAKYPAKQPYVKPSLKIIELNNADTTSLDEIKGIGATFARRIVKYKERLGGFYKKEQLLEVFGLDSLKFIEIKDQIIINPATIKKININTATFDDLKNHPYLKYKQINAILQYKKQHGNYNSPADLAKVILLNPQTIQNLTPYLTF